MERPTGQAGENRAAKDQDALVTAALTGDRLAVRRLVDLLTPIVRQRVAVAQIKVRPRRGTDTEDLVQEVLMTLFADHGRLLRTWNRDRGATFTQFCGLLAQRRAISLLRAPGPGSGASDEPEEGIWLMTPTTLQPEREAASREELMLLLRQLQARLSPLGLEVFYRLIVHDEPVEEVEAATGLSRNAIYLWRSRLIRLANQLRAELNQPTKDQLMARERTPPPFTRRIALMVPDDGLIELLATLAREEELELERVALRGGDDAIAPLAPARMSRLYGLAAASLFATGRHDPGGRGRGRV